MNILTNAVPYWVSISFLLAIVLIIHLIAITIKQGAIRASYSPQKSNIIYAVVAGFYVVYFTYISVFSFSGIFHFNELPPKIFLYSTIPFLGFLLLIVFNLPVYKIILAHVSMASLVRLHGFRLLGGFLFILYYYKAIPAQFAYIAGTGDVLIAISSVFVAKAIEKGKPYAMKLTWLWNCAGFLDVFSVMSTAIVITKTALQTGEPGLMEINSFPFCLIPAFAPPTIFFLHISIFKKLLTKKQAMQTQHELV